MRRRVAKALGFAFLAGLLVVVIAATAAMWRLSQGPLALTFLTSTVQDTINANLSDMQIGIGDVIVERDADSGRPRIRLRDIRLRDGDGNLIARAPRAAVDVNARALLSGTFRPEELALIGPRIMARRQLDGTLQLGFGVTPADEAGQTGPTPAATVGKEDRTDAAPDVAPPQEEAGVNIMDLLRREISADQAGVSRISSVMAVRITDASVSLYDEANDALWYAPQANLVVRRMPYGFALFADAAIASGKEPWRTEIVANYRTQDHRFTVSARLFDLMPADISDEVFALSQFAQVRVPLSGHAEVEFTDTGVVTKASAELTAAAGMVGFPGYVSEPIVIDEGLLRFDYDPASGDVRINNSAIYVGGSQAQLDGLVQPVRDEAGRLHALRLKIDAHNVAIDTEGAVKNPFIFDNVDFTGVASVDEAKLEVEDLVLLSGTSGMRVRGRFLGEPEGVGVYLAGAMRDVNVVMIKKLWPPIVAPGARQWIGDNVIDGRIPEGTFQIAMPARVIAAALRDEIVPDALVNSRFTLADLKFRYYEDLPAVVGGSGTAVMTGNHFTIEGEGGSVELPSGRVITATRGSIAITDLAARQSPAVIDVEGTGPAGAFLELIDLEPLRVISQQNIDVSRISGDARVNIKVTAPLWRFLKREEVDMSATAHIDNGVFKKALESADLSAMDVDLALSAEAVRANGSARLNDIPVKLEYLRNFTGSEQVEIDADLDSRERATLGADMSDYLTGSTPVKVKAAIEDGKVKIAHVEADLSSAVLKLDPIRWKRGASSGSKASFDLDLSNPNAIRISDLSLTGTDLKIAGDIHLGGDGSFRDAKFSSFRLDRENDLQLSLKDADGLLKVNAAGDAFDARPLIGDLFTGSSGDQSRPSPQPVEVTVKIGRVYANRGEIISSVQGSVQFVGGQVQRADLSGQHGNNAPIVLKISPNEQGLRDMRIVGRDGGAALRSSNLYSKIAGGILEFQALLGAGTDGTIQKGKLTIRNFEVLNEEALSSIQSKAETQNQNARKGAPQGPRRNGQFFAKLTLPFSSDAQVVRIGDALVQGPEMCATAQGIIRKADGALDIGGTIIPACAINGALGEVPVLGEILVGGKGQGLFGLTYALRGNMQEPDFLVNPVSALAPGFLRNLFGIGGVGGIAADGTIAPPPKQRESNK